MGQKGGGEWFLRDGETSDFLCEPETFIYFEMRVRDFGVISEMPNLRVV